MSNYWENACTLSLKQQFSKYLCELYDISFSPLIKTSRHYKGQNAHKTPLKIYSKYLIYLNVTWENEIKLFLQLKIFSRPTHVKSKTKNAFTVTVNLEQSCTKQAATVAREVHSESHYTV